MPLNLRIQTYRNEPVPSMAPVCYSSSGGTLGRSADNTQVLDDPSKYISRIHAKVSFRQGAYYLEDLGSNPSMVNDSPLGKGREVMLADGDRIVIGDYQLAAQLQADSFVETLFTPPPLSVAPQLPSLQFDIPATPAPAAPAVLPDALASARLLDPAAAVGFAESLDDPLGLNLPGNAAPVAQFGLHELNPPTAFRAAQVDHLSPEFSVFSMPSAGAQGTAIPEDYDLLTDVVPSAAPSAAPVFASPVQAAPSAALFAGPSSSSSNETLQALLHGLGLPDLKLEGSGPQIAQVVGAMLREATTGTMDVLVARALTKKENRMDMTMMAVRSNNPLKFFPNVDSALTQLLSNSMAGYMPPVEAMANAFDDLKAHELSVMAGMRAALSALLQRLDPELIEQLTPAAGLMDKVGGGSARKARMWDQMVAMYGEVAANVNEVQGLFGDKFSTAYEEQEDRLRRSDS